MFEHLRLPQSAREAIREWNDRFAASLLSPVPDGWAETYGEVGPTTTIQTTFPISYIDTQFRSSRGPLTFDDFGSREVTLAVQEYQTGRRAELLRLKLDQIVYQQWLRHASTVNIAEAQHRAKQTAKLLEDGENIKCYDDEKFFSTKHPANPDKPQLGTFSNFQTVAKSPLVGKNIADEQAEMSMVKDPNGDLLGIEADTMFVSGRLYPHMVDLINKQFVGVQTPGGAVTESNSLSIQKINVVKIPQLNNTLDWYLVDSTKVKQLVPWVILRMNPGMELEQRELGVGSDTFMKGGYLHISRHIWYAFGLFFPHAIRKIKGLA